MHGHVPQVDAIVEQNDGRDIAQPARAGQARQQPPPPPIGVLRQAQRERSLDETRRGKRDDVENAVAQQTLETRLARRSLRHDTLGNEQKSHFDENQRCGEAI